MIKRHDLRIRIKEEQWKKLWQLKSEILEKPFSKIIEKLIDEYFEKNHLIFDEDIKSKE